MDRRGWSAARLQQHCPQLLHHPLAGEQFGGNGDHETGAEAAADPRLSMRWSALACCQGKAPV